MNVEQLHKIDAAMVAGVAKDGDTVWLSLISEAGCELARFDTKAQSVASRVAMAKTSGMAFDGESLWGVTPDGIQRFDPRTMAVTRTLPRPPVEGFLSGLAIDGEALWLGSYHQKKLFKLDPETGEVLKTLATDRFVTGVAWAGDELWHAVDASEDETQPTELRRIDPATGRVLEAHAVDYAVSGMSSDGEGLWCGDCSTGALRKVSRGAGRGRQA
jgi:hypothetical protein